MAAKNSSPELSFGDWEDEDVDELLTSACQEGSRFANLQDTDLNKIVTESYSKSTKANTKWATKPKAFQGKYSDMEIHFRLQNSIGFGCCRQVSKPDSQTSEVHRDRPRTSENRATGFLA